MRRYVHDLLRKVVDSGDRHEEHPFFTNVDRRPQPHPPLRPFSAWRFSNFCCIAAWRFSNFGGGERGGVECVGDVVRVGVAEESERHVPVLGVNERSTHLVFAVEFLEGDHHILGWPQTNEQSAHSVILTGWVRKRDASLREYRTMQILISARPDATNALERLESVLVTIPLRMIACSGGIDSLLLAIVSHRSNPSGTVIAHTVTPAVPGDGTARVVDYAEREGWDLHIVRSGEFDDEAYLSNPTDRCYHCKSNLYDAIGELRSVPGVSNAVILSGANVDDLGEYRPGLAAAAERNVRHPYVEAQITKAEIRAIASHLDLAEADLPASPCLASRLYTGTRVTPSRLRAIEAGESLVRDRSGVDVVRCRVRESAVMIEVADADRNLIDDDLLESVATAMRSIEPSITSVELDDRAYEPGRAFVGATGTGHEGLI
ncbi:MAG: hypothetical protein ACI8V4_000113 [Ilumatobacter sp.]|jgi:uncharacterized protein